MLRLVWENPQLSDYQHREKSQVQLRLVSGQTLYGYVLNDPVNYIDPEGLETTINDVTKGIKGFQNLNKIKNAIDIGQNASEGFDNAKDANDALNQQFDIYKQIINGNPDAAKDLGDVINKRNESFNKTLKNVKDAAKCL